MERVPFARSISWLGADAHQSQVLPYRHALQSHRVFCLAQFQRPPPSEGQGLWDPVSSPLQEDG